MNKDIKILHLNLFKKYFDEIANGTKLLSIEIKQTIGKKE